jgi:DNA-binding XRE family transcriptional regulator
MQPEFTRRLVDATGIFCYDCASKNTSRSDKGGNSMDTKSLIFYRVIQSIGFMTAILRLLAPVAVVIALWLLYRIARNLEKPPKLTEEVKIVRKSLSEMLRENRARCKMTQEFVAESIGVSRQAVSKWEKGTSEPNTSNLMALAKLYGIPAEDLLRGVESALEEQKKS